MRVGEQTGFLAAADITGYTEFLTGSELQHANDLMRGLMGALTKALCHPFQVIKYEGDAVLCCAPDHALKSDALLLDLIDDAYVAFSDQVLTMKTCTTCACKACAHIRALDLKVFLHHGRFILERQAGRFDLAGPDVILLHRLMKNSARESTGISAYLLATQPAIDQLGAVAAFISHHEHYDYFGDVQCGVLDLRAAMEARRAQREVRVDRNSAQVVVEAVVSGPPSAVWDYYFDAEQRLRWDGSLTSIRSERNRRGREGVGATMHCSHGSFTSIGTTLDWKPFRYFTQEHVPAERTLMPAIMVTVETEALADGCTRVSQLTRASGRSPLARAAVALRRWRLQSQAERGLAKLDDVMRRDQLEAPTAPMAVLSAP